MLLFDTGKKLEKAFTQEQFDALVEVLESRWDKNATKEDLRETELRIQLEIEKVRAEVEKMRGETQAGIEKVHAEVEKLRVDVSRDLRELEMRMIIKLGVMLVVAIGVMATLQKLL